MFILPNTSGQAAVACLLAVLTIGVYAVIRPYHDPNDHGAYTLGALIIFLMFFMGLVVKVIFYVPSAIALRALVHRCTVHRARVDDLVVYAPEQLLASPECARIRPRWD